MKNVLGPQFTHQNAWILVQHVLADSFPSPRIYDYQNFQEQKATCSSSFETVNGLNPVSCCLCYYANFSFIKHAFVLL